MIMEHMMKRLLAVTGLCTLMASAALAQTPPAEQGEAPTKEEIEAAIKTINDMAGDPQKAAGYCAITKEMEALKEGEDEKAEELGKKMDDYLASLGDSVLDAFGIAEVVDPASEDGQKLDDAFGSLEEKCGA